MQVEVFNSLMIVFFLLIVVNLIILSALYKSTKSQEFGLLVLHWFFLGGTFLLQKFTAQMHPMHHSLIVFIPNFAVHFTIVLAYGKLVNYKVPWKKLLLIPPINIATIYILTFFNIESIYYTMPLVVTHSSLYFYMAYIAFKIKKNELNFPLRAIAVIYILYGIHMYDYVYFYTRLELFALGFALAFAFEMAISILFPASIIEKMSRENERLKVDIAVQSKLTYSAKMVALGEMAGGVAHELNNPLTILSISLDKAKNQAKDSREIIELLNRCSTTVERMSRIIKGLLTFSRESSKDQFKQVILDKLIDDCLSLCHEKFKNNGIKLDVIIPDRTIHFIGNSVQLSQVLINLLNNSFDAISSFEEKWIRLEVKDLSASLEFSVTDSGDGISDDVIDRMFNPFFTTKEVGKGTGLGLSISKGIIEKHEGKLFVDRKNKNTRIVFEIPKFHYVNENK